MQHSKHILPHQFLFLRDTNPWNAFLYVTSKRKYKKFISKPLGVGCIIYQAKCGHGKVRDERDGKRFNYDFIEIKSSNKRKTVLCERYREIWAHSDVTFYKRTTFFGCPKKT